MLNESCGGDDGRSPGYDRHVHTKHWVPSVLRDLLLFLRRGGGKRVDRRIDELLDILHFELIQRIPSPEVYEDTHIYRACIVAPV